MERERCRLYRRWIDHNSHHNRNILHTKATNIKPLKVSLDAMDILKIASGIVGGVLAKDYEVYKNGSTSDTTAKFYGPLRGNKITWHHRLKKNAPSCSAGS